MQARRDPVAGEGLLALEPLADRCEHRHLPVRPGDLVDAVGRQLEIAHVKTLGRRHVRQCTDRYSSTRPYSSSSRTTSSSSGVETSSTSESSSARIRWIAPGSILNDAPGPTTSESGIASPTAPISISI